MVTTNPARADSAAPTTWTIDPNASQVAFSIGKRLLFLRLTVTGRFAGVAGTIALDRREPAVARIDASVGVASVDTGNAKRDRHLLAADFFDAERHPTLRFTSDRVEALDLARGRGRLRGELTVRGVTRDVTFDLAFDPAQANGDRTGLRVTASAEINRHDFGLSWSSNLIIGLTDTVTITVAVAATRA